MRYPEFLKDKGTIGLVAPSFGVSGYPYRPKFDNAIKKFEKKGYRFKLCSSIFNLSHARSADARTRANEFMEMYLDDEVDFIISVAGGELMCEILPYLDFEKLRNARPKWFMGYSDNTVLTFTLPLLCDVPAMYGSCFPSFGMQRWDPSLKEAYEIMRGERLSQDNYSKYEVENITWIEGNALKGYNKTKPVVYGSYPEENVRMEGRLIGGCMDVIMTLIGTPYADVKGFMERYKDEGIIWFLEAYDPNLAGISRYLWQMKNAGWFENCKGIIMGRPVHPDPFFDIDMAEVVRENLGDLNIPVIWDADLGHVAPCWNLISGSYARIEKKENNCHIEYILK